MDEVEFTITDEFWFVDKALEYKLELVDYVRYVKPFNGCDVWITKFWW
jgi:hypothetical protein